MFETSCNFDTNENFRLYKFIYMLSYNIDGIMPSEITEKIFLHLNEIFNLLTSNPFEIQSNDYESFFEFFFSHMAAEQALCQLIYKLDSRNSIERSRRNIFLSKKLKIDDTIIKEIAQAIIKHHYDQAGTTKQYLICADNVKTIFLQCYQSPYTHCLTPIIIFLDIGSKEAIFSKSLFQNPILRYTLI